MKLGEIVVHMDNYNFTKFHQNQIKNKKVLLRPCFSVQNFNVSVESWKSYIVRVLWVPISDGPTKKKEDVDWMWRFGVHFSYLQTGNYKMARLNEAKVYREVNDGVDEYGLTPLQKLKRKKNKLQ